jgi:hypothetical protein
VSEINVAQPPLSQGSATVPRVGHLRTHSAGLAAARARGRHGGRPSVMTGHKLQVAREMYRSGQYTVAAIAKAWASAAPRSTATWIAPAADQLAARSMWPNLPHGMTSQVRLRRFDPSGTGSQPLANQADTKAGMARGRHTPLR